MNTKSFHGFHKPSGEHWHILGINKEQDQVCVAGWPPTKANLSDIEGLVEYEELTAEELAYRNDKFGNNWD